MFLHPRQRPSPERLAVLPHPANLRLTTPPPIQSALPLQLRSRARYTFSPHLLHVETSGLTKWESRTHARAAAQARTQRREREERLSTGTGCSQLAHSLLPVLELSPKILRPAHCRSGRGGAFVARSCRASLFEECRLTSAVNMNVAVFKLQELAEVTFTGCFYRAF